MKRRELKRNKIEGGRLVRGLNCSLKLQKYPWTARAVPFKGTVRSTTHLFFYLSIWCIWMERNGRCFNDKKHNLELFCSLFIALVFCFSDDGPYVHDFLLSSSVS